jgi:hypothetical protein
LVWLLLACGGSAAQSAKRSPGVAGAGGTPSAEAGGTPSAEAGGSSAVAAADGGAGQLGSALCTELGCLAGAELLYVPNRECHCTAASQTSELLETDFTPLVGPTWRVKVSSDALALDLTPSAGGDSVHGVRDQKQTERAWYELGLFAGGRFVVQAKSGQLQAEYTIYGSGVPIVGSTRGLLTNP